MTQPPGYPPPTGEPSDPHARPDQPAPQSPAPGWGAPPPGWGPPPPAEAQPPYTQPQPPPSPETPGTPPAATEPPYGPPPYSAPPFGAPPAMQPPFGAPPAMQPPFGAPPAAQPPFGAPPPVRKPHRGLLIASIVLGLVVLLCGGGATAAYFLLRSVDGRGQASPTAAVEGFLTAVYQDQDVDKATSYVCSAARDRAKLAKKIDELRSYQQKYNKSPHFSWPTPTVDKQTGNTATLTVPVKFNTDDDRVAEKKLQFTAVNEAGWWICEVRDLG